MKYPTNTSYTGIWIPTWRSAAQRATNYAMETPISTGLERDTELFSIYNNCAMKTVSPLFSQDLKLQRVALLHSNGRSYFHLERDQAEKDADCQLLGEDDLDQSTCIYLVRVHFQAEVFGSFAQTVVFDFGKRPIISRKLRIDIASRRQLDTIQKYRKHLEFKRWLKY